MPLTPNPRTSDCSSVRLPVCAACLCCLAVNIQTGSSNLGHAAVLMTAADALPGTMLSWSLAWGKTRVPTVAQKAKVAAEAPITAYAKLPATASARRCTGAVRAWAVSTSLSMSAMAVAFPLRSARTCNAYQDTRLGIYCSSQHLCKSVTMTWEGRQQSSNSSAALAQHMHTEFGRRYPAHSGVQIMSLSRQMIKDKLVSVPVSTLHVLDTC